MAHKTEGKQLSAAVEAVGHAIAGGVAGMAAIAAFYPLSSVSTRLQVQAREQAAGGPSTKLPYKGTWDAFTRIAKEEGVLAFYSGLKASLIGIAASNTVYFYWYSYLRDYACSLAGRKDLTALESLGVSSMAGVINVVSTLPIWVANTRMQLDTTKTLKDQITTVYNEEGIRGFYKGLIPSLILVSNPAVQFMVFERLKSILMKRGNRKRLIPTDAFLVGAVAKLVATFVTFPYLLVKSRLQAKGTQGVVKYAGFTDAVTKIFKADGALGFYKGINSKLVQTVLGAAFMFWVKEKVVVYTMLCIVLLTKGGQK
jgi:adenine nucleotide transporter 17